MSVLNHDEFVAKVTTAPNPDSSNEAWAVSAATVVALVAMDHEKFSKDEIVEAIQNLAFRMTGEFVQAATTNMIIIGGELN